MLPQRIGVAEQTAQTVAFHQIGVVVSKHPFGQLVVVIVMILLVRHIAEVQREHPTVTVDDVLRQTGQRMIDETLMVAVGVFHRHQREEGGIFVRAVFRHRQRRKTQRYRTVQRRNDIMPVRIFAEPNLFALEQYRFLIVFIDFRQREQTALIVDIGQSRRIADNALATRYAPALAEPAGTVLVGIIAAAPDQRQRSVEIRLLKSIVGRLKGFVFQTAFWFGWGSHQSILAVLDSNY